MRGLVSVHLVRSAVCGGDEGLEGLHQVKVTRLLEGDRDQLRHPGAQAPLWKGMISVEVERCLQEAHAMCLYG